MRIRVCTQHNTPFKGVADITLPVLREYCERHHYDLRVDVDRPIKRSIVWDRCAILVEEMERNDSDWVVHMDADVLVTNLHIRLEEFIQPGFNMVISECLNDASELKFNDGVLLVKVCPWSWETMRTVFSWPDAPGIYCGQDVLQEHFYQEAGEPDAIIRIERQKAINSFLYTEYGMPETTIGHWTPGDFVLHLPGRTNERRIELFQQYKQQILR